MGCASPPGSGFPKDTGSIRFFTTGNEVGEYNFVGELNFVGGGGVESGITASQTLPVFFPPVALRRPYQAANAVLNQQLLNASYPEMEWNWIADITLQNNGPLFRVSDKNLYVEDEDGLPRYYEARAKAPANITRTLGEWLQPDFEIGETTITLSNADGFFNKYLPNGEELRSWTQGEVEIKVGFGEKYENYFTLYRGYVAFIKGLELEDDEIKLRLYEQFEQDQVSIPTRSFNAATFPFIDADVDDSTKIPIIYGDWTQEVSLYGQIFARCLNGLEPDPENYIFKISDAPIQEITEVYLERGEHSSDTGSRPPVEIDISQLELNLQDGEFRVPANANVLDETLVVLETDFAGTGSGLNTVTSDSTDFTAIGVKEGDTVVKIGTGEQASVASVSIGSLNLTGGVTFNNLDEFRIITDSYRYAPGDIMRVKCKGKPVDITDYARLSAIDEDIDEPSALAMTVQGTYWLADNSTQKVYHVRIRDRQVLVTYDYSFFDASITSISGLVATPDERFLWVLAKNNGSIFLFDRDLELIDTSFDTGDVTGIASTLTDTRGLGLDNLNRLWVADNDTQTVYEIQPFPTTNPTLVSSFTYATVDAGMVNIEGLAYDVFDNLLYFLDSSQQQIIKSDDAGTLTETYPYSDLYFDVTNLSAISVAQDSTLFFTDRINDVLYNYLPFGDVSSNPAFIAKNLLQDYARKNFSDFKLEWNFRARTQLNGFNARLAVTQETQLVTAASELLNQFNTELYIDETRYNIFYNSFENYTTEGFLLAERDIIKDTFNPRRDPRQYFNSADSLYNFFPAANRSTRSPILTSSEGIRFSTKEVFRTFRLPSVYLQSEANQIVATRIRQSVPEPEIIDMQVGFRAMFLQPTDFVNLLYADNTGGYCPWHNDTPSQRRFNNIPGYIRSIRYDLKSMSLVLEVWSLGTTAFTGFDPAGDPPGGQFGELNLTNSGRVAFISPVGTILSAPAADQIQLEDVGAADAQTRTAADTGLAWAQNYVVALVDGATHTILETNTIASVSGDTITFTQPWTASVSASVTDSLGAFSGGTYLAYGDYTSLSEAQKNLYVSLCRPIDNYPVTIAQEAGEQLAQEHNFDDGGQPYIVGDKFNV